jgi:hypothetical protein
MHDLYVLFIFFTKDCLANLISLLINSLINLTVHEIQIEFMNTSRTVHYTN